MKDEGRKRVSRIKEAGKAAAVLFTVFVCLCGCHSRPAVNSWDSANLAAGQRLIIEQQRQRLDDMGAAVAEVQAGLDNAINTITAGLDGNADLQSQFDAIDEFVRAVIAGKRRLEELQRADGGADAGER